MYYRRKILLALLHQFDGKLDKISLQKLLFLLTRQQVQKSFCFVPYKYGCYSFQANADLHTLSKYGLTKESEKYWEKSDRKDYYIELKSQDQAAIRFVKSQFGDFSTEELVELTYKKYPYFAINSTIALNILSSEEIKKVENQRPSKKDIILYTIGYEGIVLEEYLNKLIVNDIRVLCDVRMNPVSMKFGFSKNQLQKACNGVGIEYIHIPEVGIESDKRQQLNNQEDYDKLFEFYRRDVLKNELEKQKVILQLLKSKNRIALTCFEANICKCHRKHLADSIAQLSGFHYEIKHI